MIIVDPGERSAGIACTIDDGADGARQRGAPLAAPCADRQLIAGDEQHAASAAHEVAQARPAITSGWCHLVEDHERPALQVRRGETADLPDVDAE